LAEPGAFLTGADAFFAEAGAALAEAGLEAGAVLAAGLTAFFAEAGFMEALDAVEAGLAAAEVGLDAVFAEEVDAAFWATGAALLATGAAFLAAGAALLATGAAFMLADFTLDCEDALSEREWVCDAGLAAEVGLAVVACFCWGEAAFCAGLLTGACLAAAFWATGALLLAFDCCEAVDDALADLEWVCAGALAGAAFWAGFCADAPTFLWTGSAGWQLCSKLAGSANMLARPMSEPWFALVLLALVRGVALLEGACLALTLDFCEVWDDALAERECTWGAADLVAAGLAATACLGAAEVGLLACFAGACFC
jgi:hypothetical protein